MDLHIIWVDINALHIKIDELFALWQTAAFKQRLCAAIGGDNLLFVQAVCYEIGLLLSDLFCDCNFVHFQFFECFQQGGAARLRDNRNDIIEFALDFVLMVVKTTQHLCSVARKFLVGFIISRYQLRDALLRKDDFADTLEYECFDIVAVDIPVVAIHIPVVAVFGATVGDEQIFIAPGKLPVSGVCGTADTAENLAREQISLLGELMRRVVRTLFENCRHSVKGLFINQSGHTAGNADDLLIGLALVVVAGVVMAV